MKIKGQLAESISGIAQNELRRAQTGAVSGEEVSKKEATVEQDQVNISLAQQIRGTLEPNTAKIERLKKEIANGTYKVSSTDIADKFLATVEEESFFSQLLDS